MKKLLSKLISAVIASSLAIGSMSFEGIGLMSAVSGAESAITVNESSGWFESAYIEWAPVSGTAQYVAYYKKSSDSSYTQLDDELIRSYGTYWRADAVGLSEGTYDLKVEAYDKNKSVIASGTATGLTVTAYDRSGAAFSSKSTYKSASGAYNDDGTLKSNAKVLYITKDTAKTVTADIITSSKGATTTCKGFQAIIDAKQKGYDTTPLDFRIVGTVSASDVDSFSSSSEGIQIKGKNADSEMNITIEGIGEDAVVHGFGFLVRNCGNVEFRNFGILYFMDDGISMDTDNSNIWVHNIDIFYGTPGSASDQKKGDGSVDVKADSKFVTISYNHFWDSGKCSLCGMKSETSSTHITYHHNWFDHSDSRHPRVRTMSVHAYNNYFDGNSKYGIASALGASIFSQNNYFDNCKYPMVTGNQATENGSILSGEAGGVIKSYGNIINNATAYVPYTSGTNFDAYEASSATEAVSSSVATAGGYTYNNFDTSSSYDLHVKDLDEASDVPTVVTKYAGRMNGGDFPANKSSYTGMTSATSYDVDSDLSAAIKSYTSSVVSIGGVTDGSTAVVTQTTTTASETSTESTTSGTIEDSSEETTTVIDESAMIHNFTANGTTSSFYTISGNLSTSYGTVTYNGLTLTQCLKMETSTYIDFSPENDGTLIVVTNPNYSGTIELDDSAIEIASDGIATLDISGGVTHELSKGSGSNYIFYLAFIPDKSEDSSSTTETTTETTTTTTTEATTTASDTPSAGKSTITDNQTLDISNYENNEYFDVSYYKLSDSNTSLQLTSGNKISFTVAAGASVTVNARHASGTEGTADRTISMGDTSAALKQGAGFSDVVLGENLSAGTYEITVSDAINIKSVTVTFSASPTALTGDATNDGIVNSADVQMVLDYASGKINSVTNGELADVSGDGTVTAYDAYLIGKIILGLLN